MTVTEIAISIAVPAIGAIVWVGTIKSEVANLRKDVDDLKRDKLDKEIFEKHALAMEKIQERNTTEHDRIYEGLSEIKDLIIKGKV